MEGFVAVLQQMIEFAERGILVACSINLDPTHLGHYAFKLVDGQAKEGDVELEEPTAPTAPGKGQGRKR
jgi:hypothetical protein